MNPLLHSGLKEELALLQCQIADMAERYQRLCVKAMILSAAITGAGPTSGSDAPLPPITGEGHSRGSAGSPQSGQSPDQGRQPSVHPPVGGPSKTSGQHQASANGGDAAPVVKGGKWSAYLTGNAKRIEITVPDDATFDEWEVVDRIDQDGTLAVVISGIRKEATR